MRQILMTSAVVAMMAGTMAAQPQCSGLAFDASCGRTPTPKVRATFGDPLSIWTSQDKAQPAPQPFTEAAWAARARPPAALPSANPAIDCQMLKHSAFGDDAPMVRQTHPAYKSDRGVISVSSCANPATSTPKK